MNRPVRKPKPVLCQVWPRLERRILKRHDATSVCLFVLLAWPLLSILWVMQTVALLVPAAGACFHLPVLWVVHIGLSLLMAWLAGMAFLGWRLRGQPGAAPRLVQATLLPGLLGLALLSLAYGLTDTPMCMVLMAQIVFARALFSWRQVRVALVALLLLAALASAWMLAPSRDLSPMLKDPVYQGSGMVLWWVVWTRVVFGMAVLPVSLVLFYFASLLGRRQRDLETLVRTDGLTGLANRREFMTQLERESHRQARSGRPMCVLLFDVDHFKQVNDNWGHPVGDEVLAGIGRILREHTRERVDTAARYGGEEFVLLLPETDLGGATLVADKIRARLAEQVFTAEGQPFTVTQSVGIAEVAEGQVAWALRVADRNLYQAKLAGRDRVVASPAGAEAG
jgi:diguanylate cyclase (GGDEF)-like protein